MEQNQQNNPNNVDTNPFDVKAEIVPGQSNATRLVEIGYNCHLCNGQHEAQYYITSGEQQISDMTEEISGGLDNRAFQGFLKSPEFQGSINAIAKLFHRDQGDYDNLNLLYEMKTEKPAIEITSLVLTDETQYTCDNCQSTFESVGLLRIHQGQDPITMEKITNPRCWD